MIEWGAALYILTHEPRSETTIPALHPPSALYENAFDPSAAVAEHREFVHAMRDFGAEVVTVHDVLLRAPIDELRVAALESVELDLSAIPAGEHETHFRHVQRSISVYSAEQLIEVCLLRPKLTIRPSGTNTGYAASYAIRPLSNLMFMRDQTITTAKGRVLCHMASEQREPETALLRHVLRWIGQDPIYTVTGAGRLEGGDFIPAGKVCFIGVGLRTNEDAVKQLLRAQVFGKSVSVVVVHDAWCNQEEMHLDTYFNILGPTGAVLCERRFSAAPGSEQFLRCDVYTHSGADADDVDASSETGPYVLADKGQPFLEVLARNGFTSIIPVSKEDQLIYGCNFLTLGANNILLVKRGAGVSEAYKAALRAAGVTYREVQMSALTSEYGAAHCLTQVSRMARPASS